MKEKYILLPIILCLLNFTKAINTNDFTQPVPTPPDITQPTPTPPATSYQDLGVFVGAESSAISKMVNYNTVIIDAQYFTQEEIATIKTSGAKVYSYLNIGSIEDFRSYFNDFSHLSLGAYENWPGEFWIDVSDKSWIDYNIQTIAKGLVDKGIDGFFIDNIDVYYYSATDEIYQGLSSFLTQLKASYQLPVLLNGGYSFVQSTLSNGTQLSSLMNGITHESVYSKINFNTGKFKTNSIKTRNFYLDYFKQVAPLGIDIYIIEYTTDQSLIQEFMPYYEEHGYHYYISNSIELD